MSRDLHVCILDLDKLAAVQGSSDKKLLKKILKKNQNLIEYHDEYFRKQSQPEPYSSLATAIQQIIDGAIDRRLTPRFQFEHAAAIIADTLGTHLDSQPLMEAKESFWNEVDTVIEKKRRAAQVPKSVWPTLREILKRGPLLDVPVDSQMGLGTGYLTAEEVQMASKATASIDLSDTKGLTDLTWPQLALDAVRQYQNWLDKATRKKIGLFFHC